MVTFRSTVSSVTTPPPYLLLAFFLLALVVLGGCAASDDEPVNVNGLEGVGTGEAADPWSILMSRNAYPFTTPLPPAEKTVIDGTYVKFDPKVATPIPCRRCPDYMNEGGIWKLSFEKGTFHILHLVTGWTGIGSYTVEGERLILFNDPKCLSETGLYSWRHVNGDLVLESILDHCAADMRSHNLEQMVWRNCAEHSKSSDEDSDYIKPPGC